MFELAAVVIVSAVALTFFTDATSRVVKMARPRKRGGNIHVAAPEHSH